ncbi:MAG: hypothetical protein WBM17_14230 [Anaerolineales bacterium]
MPRRPNTATFAFALILLNAIVWLFFAILIALDLHPALPDSAAVRWIMGILAIGCACLLLALVVLLGRRIRMAYFLTLGLLALLVILTITDEVGLADWIYLLLVAAPILLLVKDRSWYLTQK